MTRRHVWSFVKFWSSKTQSNKGKAKKLRERLISEGCSILEARERSIVRKSIHECIICGVQKLENGFEILYSRNSDVWNSKKLVCANLSKDEYNKRKFAQT